MNKSVPFHYAVADGLHFRFEKSPPNFEALVQFGGADVRARLADLFAAIEK